MLFIPSGTFRAVATSIIPSIISNIRIPIAQITVSSLISQLVLFVQAFVSYNVILSDFDDVE